MGCFFKILMAYLNLLYFCCWWWVFTLMSVCLSFRLGKGHGKSRKMFVAVFWGRALVLFWGLWGVWMEDFPGFSGVLELHFLAEK